MNQSNINSTKLQAYPIPICSSAEQGEIVQILDSRLQAAEMVNAEIEAALARAEALRQSILKKAFSGQPVRQDPTDEPGAALLARIRAKRDRAPARGRKRRAEV